MNKIANILASTHYGSLIVNRFDYLEYSKPWGEAAIDGVGHNLLETSTYEEDEVKLSCDIIRLMAQLYPGPITALDVGANIGIYTVAWAKTLQDIKNDGYIVAIEPQEWVFYSLCGNIALNNCMRARAIMAAVGDHNGTISIPKLNYTIPCSYGSLVIEAEHPERNLVPLITLDSLCLDRLDFLKIDVETMEQKVLDGAIATIDKLHPIVMIEFYHDPKIKDWFDEHGYVAEQISNMNMLCVPIGSPVIPHLIRKEKDTNNVSTGVNSEASGTASEA